MGSTPIFLLLHFFCSANFPQRLLVSLNELIFLQQCYSDFFVSVDHFVYVESGYRRLSSLGRQLWVSLLTVIVFQNLHMMSITKDEDDLLARNSCFDATNQSFRIYNLHPIFWLIVCFDWKLRWKVDWIRHALSLNLWLTVLVNALFVVTAFTNLNFHSTASILLLVHKQRQEDLHTLVLTC